MTAQRPSGAEIVIVGGGAVGCGVAYALAKAGRKDILLLEREPQLAAATTSQGAGLAGQLRSSIDRTRLAMHSVATFVELEKSAAAKPGWRAVGSLRVAETAERVEEFDRLERIAKAAGLAIERLDAAGARKLCPPFDFSRAKSVIWCPTDGYMSPVQVVAAYESQCRAMGVRFLTSTRIEGIALKNSRVEAVETSAGRIECRYLINAAGANAYHVARLAGLELPIVPVRHEYFVSVAIPGLHPGIPCFRIPDATLYGRADGDGLLLGGWEPDSRRIDPRSYDLTDRPPPVEPDAPVLDSFAAKFEPYLPAVRGVHSRRLGKGWPTFTPDGKFIIGPSSRVEGFVMAGGCNAHGISGSGGIGKLLVESMLEARPSEYVRSLSPDRFPEGGWTWEDASRKAQRVYETYYALESC
jgi:glycine/D-amino acid oxidase-like deaminating enzyme